MISFWDKNKLWFSVLPESCSSRCDSYGIKYTSFFFFYISVCAQSCGRKTHRSTAERLAVTQVLLQATIWEAGPCLSLFRRCVKPYVYAVFLQLPCESIPSRQRFYLEDKLITAREFNAHVRPGLQKSGVVRTVRAYYSDDEISVTSRTMYAVPRILSEVYFGLKSSEPSTKVLWETVSDLSDLSKLLILHVLPFKKFLLTQTLKVWLFDQKYSKTIIFWNIVAI